MSPGPTPGPLHHHLGNTAHHGRHEGYEYPPVRGGMLLPAAPELTHTHGEEGQDEAHGGEAAQYSLLDEMVDEKVVGVAQQAPQGTLQGESVLE